MATMTIRAETSPLFYRWLDALPSAAGKQRIAEPLLALYWECMQDETPPSVPQIAACLECDEATATQWSDILATHLVAPSYYDAIFSAEDIAAEGLVQRSAHAADVQATEKGLAELNDAIAMAKTDAYALLSDEKAAALTAKIEKLDQARVDLLRHQGDLPRCAQMLRDAQAAEGQRLAAARQELGTAYQENVNMIDDTWGQEALAALVPMLHATLARLRHVDTARQMLGCDVNTGGTARFKEELLRQLRR